MNGTARDLRPVAAGVVDGRVHLTIRPVVFEAAAILVLIGVALGFAMPAFDVAGPIIVLAHVLFAAMSVGALAGLGAHPHARFGLANAITGLRAALTALMAAAILDAGRVGPDAAPVEAWAFAGLVALTLALDGLDGYAARRGGHQSAFGARFDMEVDAFLVFALAAVAVAGGKVDAFVILLGAMRYVYLGVLAIFTRLPRDLPPSYARKTICVIQISSLCVIMTPLVQPPLSNTIAVAALVLLTLSFGRDLVSQVRRRRLPDSVVP